MRDQRRPRGLRLVAVDEIDGHGEREVARIAAVQRGVIAVDQLRAAGLDGDDVARRRRLGRLHPLTRGVYLVGHPEPAPLAVETAALLAAGPRAVLSHGSSAHLSGLLRSPPAETHVTVAGRRPRRRTGICVHRVADLHPADLWVRDGLPATRPARTIVDLAAAGWDEHALDRALAEAIAVRATTVEEVRAAMERAANPRGRGRLEALLGDGPAVVRSGGERALLALIRRAGLPEPETNARLGPWTVDLLWREQRLVVELDGHAAHSSPWARDRDARKTLDLQRAGWRVIRFTGRQLARTPEWVLVQIAAALA